MGIFAPFDFFECKVRNNLPNAQISSITRNRDFPMAGNTYKWVLPIFTTFTQYFREFLTFFLIIFCMFDIL